MQRQLTETTHKVSALLACLCFVLIREDWERLPFVWKTRKFRWEFKWNGLSRGKFSGKKVILFEVLPFYRFYRNDRDFLYHSSGLLVPGFMSRESEKIYRYFVNGTTQSRSCFRCQKKHTSTIWRKFFTGISVQMVSALECLTICICHKIDSTLSSLILSPFVLVRPGFAKNPRPPVWQTGSYPTELTGRPCYKRRLNVK